MSQLSSVQLFLSSQTFGVPLLQEGLPSLSATHFSPSVQGFLSSQTMGLPPHLPLLQTSLSVQATPSSQGLPSVALWPQAPVLVSQVSTVQPLPSSHILLSAHRPMASTGLLLLMPLPLPSAR